MDKILNSAGLFTDFKVFLVSLDYSIVHSLTYLRVARKRKTFGEFLPASCLCYKSISVVRKISQDAGLPPHLSVGASKAGSLHMKYYSLSSFLRFYLNLPDCHASSGKEKTKCDRIAPWHPLSWPCVSDLLTTTSKARADYAP